MTERDVVLRERAAFLNGVWQAHIDRLVCQDKHRTVGLYEWDAECNKALLNTHGAAQTHYPLLVTQPRVVEDTHGIKWRFVEERLEFRTIENWYPMLGAKSAPDGRYGIALLPTPERIKLWADLLAQPTETVDA